MSTTIRLLVYSALLGLAATHARAASADDQSLHFDLPFTLQTPAAVPAGFENQAALAPIHVNYAWEREPAEHPVLILGASASFPRYSLIPALGLSPGLRFRVAPFILEVALELEDQKLWGKGPFDGSAFDTWITGLRAGIRGQPAPQAMPELTLGLEARVLALNNTTVASYEGLDTQVNHRNTWVASPWLALELPAGLRFRARLDVYALGAAAIASKEFALGIAGQTVERLGVELSSRFGPERQYELSLSYAWVTGARDPVELAYLAPFFSQDYLLTPQTLTGGITWHF